LTDPAPFIRRTEAPGTPAAPGTPGMYGPGMPGRPAPAPKPPLLRPRKVRGGVKLPAGDVAGPTAWAAQRWLRMLEQASEGAALVEGLDYARQGQTKRMGISAGRIEGSVQGRGDRPYSTTLSLGVIASDAWERVVIVMAEGSLYAAKLLAGELPPNIEDVFMPLGLKLFPAEPSEVVATCTCGQLEPGKPWCKHAVCLGYLVGHRLASEPFLMFAVRGLEGHELLERIRQRRSIAGAVSGIAPVYTQRVPGVSDLPSKPLEECLDQFWESGPSLAELDLPLAPPAVTHPLLRRLGPSPFQAQFPLVGLLASCYDVISEEALKGPAETAPQSDGDAAEAEHASDDEPGDDESGDDESGYDLGDDLGPGLDGESGNA
jgi:uncharacterized Zn finger protein